MQNLSCDWLKCEFTYYILFGRNLDLSKSRLYKLMSKLRRVKFLYVKSDKIAMGKGRRNTVWHE